MPRPRIVTPDKEKAWIYGFYDDAAKEFLYVGQTLEPYYRRKAHVQGRLAKPELQSPTVRYIVLRQTRLFTSRESSHRLFVVFSVVVSADSIGAEEVP